MPMRPRLTLATPDALCPGLSQLRAGGGLHRRPLRDVHRENAQGKTNLLEAVHTLAALKGFRARRNRELLRHGQDAARVSGLVFDGESRRQLSVELSPTGRNGRVDGKSPAQLEEYFASLRAVVFTPEDVAIVREGPELRRRFLDRAAFTARAGFLEIAQAFRGASGAEVRAPAPRAPGSPEPGGVQRASGHRRGAALIKVLKGLEAPPACTSATPTTAGACTSSSTRRSTTPSTRPWPATATGSRSPSTSTAPLHGRGQRPRHPRRHARHRGPQRRRGHHDRAARRRQVRRQLLQGLGGLHGVGISCVNALSRVARARDPPRRRHYRQRYAAACPRRPCPRKRPRRTRHPVRFLPDRTIFQENNEFSFDILSARLRELSFLEPGVEITSSSTSAARACEHDFKYEGGIGAFVEHLNRNKTRCTSRPSTSRGARGIESSWRCSGTTPTKRTCSASPTTSATATAAPTSRAFATRSPARSTTTPPRTTCSRAQGALSGEDIREGLTASSR
jgi:hypothetical protein